MIDNYTSLHCQILGVLTLMSPKFRLLKFYPLTRHRQRSRFSSDHAKIILLAPISATLLSMQYVFLTLHRYFFKDVQTIFNDLVAHKEMGYTKLGRENW